MRAALLAALWLTCACSAPLRCAKSPIVIDKHPTKAKPAGRVVVGCDGRTVVVIDADEVVR